MSLEMDRGEMDGKSAGDEVKCKSCSASLMPAVTYSAIAKASLFCGWNWKLWPTLSRFLHDRVVEALQSRLPQTPFAPSYCINRVPSWVTQHKSLHRHRARFMGTKMDSTRQCSRAERDIGTFRKLLHNGASLPTHNCEIVMLQNASKNMEQQAEYDNRKQENVKPQLPAHLTCNSSACLS